MRALSVPGSRRGPFFPGASCTLPSTPCPLRAVTLSTPPAAAAAAQSWKHYFATHAKLVLVSRVGYRDHVMQEALARKMALG